MKDKKYTLEIIHTEKGFSMERVNSGFNVYEMIGFVELIKNELIQQAESMFNNSDIKRTFHTDKFDGDVEINIRDKEKTNV